MDFHVLCNTMPFAVAVDHVLALLPLLTCLFESLCALYWLPESGTVRQPAPAQEFPQSGPPNSLVPITKLQHYLY